MVDKDVKRLASLRRHELVCPNHRHLRATEKFKQHLNPIMWRQPGDHGEDIAPRSVRQPDIIAWFPAADFLSGRLIVEFGGIFAAAKFLDHFR